MGGILGANGAGKSALVKLIMGKRKPVLGTASMTNEVQVGYFSQHHVDDLDMNMTPLQQLAKEFGSEITRQQLYAQLGRFNLGKELAERKIKTLSGGQKSRVTLAILTWWQPHLIIMDEPTNHLDMPTIDALAIALSDFEGTVLIVSHDQYFVETCCDEFWCVGDRKITQFDDFQKCREFSKKSRAPDILPREFATVEVSKKVDTSMNYKYAMGQVSEEEEKKENPKKKEVIKKEDVFGIDPEREIDKGLEKGLTPNGILRHLKGWNPSDDQITIVTKLGFIMFHDYFDDKTEKYEELDHFGFFEPWKNIINYCIPLDHRTNQQELINIALKCYVTAKRDNDQNKRVNTTYSFGLMLESLCRKFGMISVENIEEYIQNKKSDEKKWTKLSESEKDVINQMGTFLTMAMEEEDDDDDSDSD